MNRKINLAEKLPSLLLFAADSSHQRTGIGRLDHVEPPEGPYAGRVHKQSGSSGLLLRLRYAARVAHLVWNVPHGLRRTNCAKNRSQCPSERIRNPQRKITICPQGEAASHTGATDELDF